MIDEVAQAIVEMPLEELQVLADLINQLLKDKKEEENSEVKIGDMVSFEPKKGIVVEGVVTELTKTRAKVNVHSGSGECSTPLNDVIVTFSAPVEDIDIQAETEQYME
jgi:hypothetical protein|tara:strand:- start:2253 stop:2576 length:324 start_codon:yes stop_codon:yes gene_type:complete